VLSYAIPGAVFVHQGQMAGFVEKLPVQRRFPLLKETPDEALRLFYQRLLAIVRAPVFRDGELHVIGTDKDVILAIRRRGAERVLVGANPCGHRHPTSPSLELSFERLGIPLGATITCTDLFTGEVLETLPAASALHLEEGAVASWEENQAFLIAIS
jgi:hypothetical protein